MMTACGLEAAVKAFENYPHLVVDELKAWDRHFHKKVEAKDALHYACVKHAKQQGLRFYNRRRFMKQCMAQRPSWSCAVRQ
jgi:hypothetical protein